MGAAGIIAAILALIGTGLSAYTNYRSQQSTNELQTRLADQANQWQIENRDYENWFNSPAGLQSRGLNPYLSMSAAGGTLAQSANAGAANLPSDIKAPQIPDFGSSIAGAASAGSQLSLTQSQVALNEAQAELVKGNNRRADEQQGLILQHLSAEVDKLTSEKQYTDVLSAYTGTLDNKAQQEAKNLELDWMYKNSTLQDRIDIVSSEKEIKAVEASKIAESLSASIYSAKAYTNYLYTQAEYIPKEFKLNQFGKATERISALADANYKFKSVELEQQLNENRFSEIEANIKRLEAEAKEALSKGKTIDAKRVGEVITQYTGIINDFYQSFASMLTAIGNLK